MSEYQDIVEKIDQTRRFGNQPGVEITGKMLEVLGHPEQGIPYIHVAGTNGKGSTCAFIRSILQEMGLKVGFFTSPHLVDYRERITINEQMISHAEVVRLGRLLLETDFGVSPTMFDCWLVMAVLYFKEQHCDIVIYETGLGGRLDSTNALGMPLVSVITRIGYDHTAILGDTLAAIAEEKAGIMKGTKTVIGPQEPEAERVLRSHAQKENAYEVLTDADVAEMKDFSLGLIGAYQMENAAIARATVQMIEEELAQLRATSTRKDIPVCDREGHETEMSDNDRAEFAKEMADHIRDGLAKARWMGRMQILSQQPFVMVDGAHNSNGVRALRDSLTALYPGERFHFIMAVMADKDYEEMVTLLLPITEDFATVTVESSRALQGEALADFIRDQGIRTRCLAQLSDVKSYIAETAADSDKKIVALGSLYFVGDLLQLQLAH